MTAERLFAPSSAEQAKALLADAADDRRFATPYLDESHRVLFERDAATAMYAAQAATAHALLAVHDQMVYIGACLQAAARTPVLLHELAEQVTAVGQSLGEKLTELGTDVCDVHKAIEDSAVSTVTAVDCVKGVLEDGLGDIASRLWKPAPWWRRLWWKLRGFNPDEWDADDEQVFAVENFRLDLMRLAGGDDKPIASAYIYAANIEDAHAAADAALRSLVKQSGADPDAAELYGELWIDNGDDEPTLYYAPVPFD